MKVFCQKLTAISFIFASFLVDLLSVLFLFTLKVHFLLLFSLTLPFFLAALVFPLFLAQFEKISS